MEWTPHGFSGSGFLQELGCGQSKAVPAVATHRGRLWCLWTDFDGRLWYAATTKDGEFGAREAFPQDGLAVAASLDGQLHAVVALEATGQLLHYCFDADERQAWDSLGALDAPAGVVPDSGTPALAAFRDELVLAYLRDGRLYATAWSASRRQWTPPAPVAPPGPLFTGTPALLVLNGALHILCAGASPGREALGYRYDDDAAPASWTPCGDVSEGRAASGASAACYGSSAYLGFVEAGRGGGEAGAACVAAHAGGAWQPREAVAGARAAAPPQLAVLNGRVHAVFADAAPARDLRWYSRPARRGGGGGYSSLAGWMGAVPDATLLSALTVPGTHDSCARSTLPFVRTQNLTVPQQLAMGVRFLDLRLRVRPDDGRLYCYHGGVPLGLPRHTSFDEVMDEVWAFLRPDAGGGAAPTETVLVSINNDDSSSRGRADPAPFYAAVAAALLRAPPLPDGRSRWYLGGLTPRLGDVRGRAVLLRRYRGGGGGGGPAADDPRLRAGLDLSAWVNNSADFTIVTPTGVRVRLQDRWRYTERMSLRRLVASKSGFVRRMMERASGVRLPGAEGAAAADDDDDDDDDGGGAGGDSGAETPSTDGEGDRAGPAGDDDDEADSADTTWFINFCSAVGDPAKQGEMAQAKWVAVGARANLVGEWVDGMNVVTRACLERGLGPGGRRRRARLGIVPLDYPELPEGNDLVARLVETNFTDV